MSIPVIKPGTRLKIGTLLLREIHAEIHDQGGAKPLAMRLWTSLLDEKEHPATALVELYASRWEEELFFRELKSHLHGRNNLLDAQTPETAAQEVLAMLLAASLVAMHREVVPSERAWRSCGSALPKCCTRPPHCASCWRWGEGSHRFRSTDEVDRANPR